MNNDLYIKKQVVFPDLFTRIITLLFDLVLLSVILTWPTQQLSFLLFKANFTNFIAQNNLIINSAEDIKLIYTTENITSFPTIKEVAFFWGEFLVCQYLLISIYFIFCWTKFGTTIGKYIFKIKIMDFETGSKPTIKQSIVRYLSYVFFTISIFTVLFKEKRRALHDIFSGTIVIKN